MYRYFMHREGFCGGVAHVMATPNGEFHCIMTDGSVAACYWTKDLKQRVLAGIDEDIVEVFPFRHSAQSKA